MRIKNVFIAALLAIFAAGCAETQGAKNYHLTFRVQEDGEIVRGGLVLIENEKKEAFSSEINIDGMAVFNIKTGETKFWIWVIKRTSFHFFGQNELKNIKIVNGTRLVFLEIGLSSAGPQKNELEI